MKLYIYAGIAVLVAFLMAITAYQHGKINDLQADNERLTGQVKYFNSYITKYEAAKAENEAMTSQLLTMMESVKDENCHVPASLLSVLKQLRR